MNYPIRILHCVVHMGRGGAETLLMSIYRNIDRSKIQFDFLTSHPGVFDDEIESLGGKVYRIPYITQAKFNYYKHVRKFFAEHSEYKIVHSHMDRMSGIIMKEAKRAGIPVRIAHSHNTQSEGNIVEKSIKKYYGLYVGRATKRYACSGEAARFMFGNKTAEIIKNGIESSRFVFDKSKRQSIRKELGINDKYVVMHIGRFDKQKNQTFLIDIFASLHRKKEESVLLLAGDGILREKIQEKVKKMGLDKSVIFLGNRSNINELLMAADVFVFPSLFEGLGIVAIEAQASGLKCVLSDTIPREACITDNVQYISLNQPPEKWAEAILEYDNGYTREDMSAVVEKQGYDVNAIAKKLEKTYTELYNSN